MCNLHRFHFICVPEMLLVLLCSMLCSTLLTQLVIISEYSQAVGDDVRMISERLTGGRFCCAEYEPSPSKPHVCSRHGFFIILSSHNTLWIFYLRNETLPKSCTKHSNSVYCILVMQIHLIYFSTQRANVNHNVTVKCHVLWFQWFNNRNL